MKTSQKSKKDYGTIISGVVIMIAMVWASLIPPVGGWDNAIFFLVGLLMFLHGAGWL